MTYGKYFRRLHIQCYQQDRRNTENTCSFIDILLSHEELRLTHFKLELCEQNPFFYSGGRFLSTLRSLFKSPAVSTIRKIDFSKFPVAINDDLLDCITTNVAPNMEYFDIQNKVFASRISAKCFVNFVKNAPKLKYLSVRSTYFTTDVINVFIDYKMHDLKLVKLLFTRAEKFFKNISGGDWRKLSEQLPNMRIALKFDHTYPLHCTYNILLPEVPVSVLKLCLHAICYQHVNLAASMYKKTLEKLVVVSTPSDDLDYAVLRLVQECDKVKDLHVKCRMDKKVVSQIHGIKSLRNYTLPFLSDMTSA